MDDLSNRWAALSALGGRQHQFVTAADARQVGIPESTLRRRAREEGWAHPHRGVWGLPGAAMSPLRQIAAGLLAVGDPVFAARRSAAWLWGMWHPPPNDVDVLVPDDRRPRRLDRVRVRRSGTLQPEDVAVRMMVRVTTPARTIADLASVLHQERLLAMVISARQRDLVTIDSLVAQHRLMGKAPGAAKLRRVLVLQDAERVDSMLELEIRRELARLGFPAPSPHPIYLPTLNGGRIQVDVPWQPVRVGLEVDGFQFHRTHEDLVRDHRKTNQAAVADWILLRVGYWRWRNDRPDFLDELARVLTARGAPAPSKLDVYRR